ncbi:hypothetical protein ACFL03_12010 [Thermodesulfobacteriota bacterium]
MDEWNIGMMGLKEKGFLYKYIWFFSNLVGEEGPRIQGVKDSSVCSPTILSVL